MHSRAGSSPWLLVAACAAVAAVVSAATSWVVAGVVAGARGGVQQPGPTVTATVTPSQQPSAPPGTPRDLAQLYQQVSGGIVRIETTACDDGGVGTGFLVAPDLVATVAHVVDAAHSVLLTIGDTSVPASVIGLDDSSEVALLRARRPLPGYVFTLSRGLPPVGTDVAAIGFPLAGPIALTRGTVSGLDRSMTTDDGRTRRGLVQVDAPINPGASGGPLLTREGSVVGLVEARATDAQGIGFAVPATTAAPLLATWEQHAAPPPAPADCETPVGPSQVRVDVSDVSGAPAGAAVAAMLADYATGINTGRFGDAYALFSARLKQRSTLEQFSAGERSSHLFDVVLHALTPTAAGVTAEVSFGSVQDARYGRDGQTCSQWRITYQLVPDLAGGYLIDRATPATGAPQSC